MSSALMDSLTQRCEALEKERDQILDWLIFRYKLRCEHDIEKELSDLSLRSKVLLAHRLKEKKCEA